MGAKDNSLPLEYRKKLNAIEPNEYTEGSQQKLKTLSKRGKNSIDHTYGYFYVLG